MCLDILFNYKPVAMEKDGADLRNLVADTTRDMGSRGAATQLDTGTGALCSAHVGSQARACISSSRHASLFPPPASPTPVLL